MVINTIKRFFGKKCEGCDDFFFKLRGCSICGRSFCETCYDDITLHGEEHRGDCGHLAWKLTTCPTCNKSFCETCHDDITLHGEEHRGDCGHLTWELTTCPICNKSFCGDCYDDITLHGVEHLCNKCLQYSNEFYSYENYNQLCRNCYEALLRKSIGSGRYRLEPNKGGGKSNHIVRFK